MIGLCAAVGDRERDHLVEDQYDAEPRGHLTQPLQELRAGGDHPGRAQHRLDQDRGDVCALALEDLLRPVRVVERELDHLSATRGSTPAGTWSARC